MKIPEIKSRNRIRDTYICIQYLEGKTQAEIAEDKRVNLSQTHVGRILYKHRNVLIYDKNYEKVKRINWLKKQIEKRGESKKDGADLVDQLRIEIEGNKVEHVGKDGEILPTPIVNVYVTKNTSDQRLHPGESIASPRISGV